VIIDRKVCLSSESIQRTNVWAWGMPVQCPPTQQKTLSKGHAAAAEAAACCFLPLNNSVTQLKGKLSLKVQD
jgi:hypothetical protein